jgi:hypothetical protein
MFSVRAPVNVYFVTRKLSTIEKRRKDKCCFGREIAEKKAADPEILLKFGSV